MIRSHLLGSGRVFPPALRRITHNHNYKVYFPRDKQSIQSASFSKPIYARGPTYTAQQILNDRRFRDEPLWIRITTYTACLMTLGLFWTFYKYREPVYCNERMQLSFLSDEAVDGHLLSSFEKLKAEIGLVKPFAEPFTVSERSSEYVRIREVFDKLVAAGQLDVMNLELHLMVNDKFSESYYKICPWAITVNGAELMLAQTPESVATLLAPRIARKAMNHQSELLNHCVFACFATIPAILFGIVALRSKPARAFAVPYFWYYGGLIGFQNTFLLSRQLNEADYVGLNMMFRAGYDISKAIDYRKRLVKEGERVIDNSKEYARETPWTILMIKDTALEKLELTSLHKWTAVQRIHAANMEKFVPMVNEKLAGEMTRQIDDGEEEEGEEEEGEGEEGEEEEGEEEEGRQ